MDSCHGTCPLKSRDCAEIVADALRHFDGDRYLLGDFVIMPNHVHLLFGGLARTGCLPKSPRGRNGRPSRSTSSSACGAGFGRTKASIIWSGARPHSIGFVDTSPKTRRRRGYGLASLSTGSGPSEGSIPRCRLPPERLRSAQRTVQTTRKNTLAGWSSGAYRMAHRTRSSAFGCQPPRPTRSPAPRQPDAFFGTTDELLADRSFRPFR